MDIVNLPAVRYWSVTHLSDLWIKVMDFKSRFLLVFVAKHKSGELCCPGTALITWPDIHV